MDPLLIISHALYIIYRECMTHNVQKYCLRWISGRSTCSNLTRYFCHALNINIRTSPPLLTFLILDFEFAASNQHAAAKYAERKLFNVEAGSDLVTLERTFVVRLRCS